MTWSDRAAIVRRLLGRCLRLGPRDGATGLLAWALLHATVLRLRLLPAWRPAPDRWDGDVTGPADPRVARLVRLFGEAARHEIVGGWCLPRAVALRGLLRLHGLPAQLALGLRRGAEGLGGHAWVVYHGCALGEDADVLGSFARCQVS
jgi:hypothetical protein